MTGLEHWHGEPDTTSRDTRILAWRLVLLPLLLWAMALWQGHRADEHRTLLLEDRGQLHVFIAQVEEMQRARDHRDVQFNGRSINPYLAKSMAVLRLNETERELTFARIGSVLAQWSLPLAAVLTWCCSWPRMRRYRCSTSAGSGSPMPSSMRGPGR